MTENQIARVREKIRSIRYVLASEKRKYGGYDDSRGLRYAPTSLFVKIRDYAGGMTYLRWFNKNFPGDVGFPGFLFESTIICFKMGKWAEAEKAAIRTFFSRRFVIQFFLNGEPVDPKLTSYLQSINVHYELPEFTEFGAWLENFISSERFLQIKNKVEELERQLETEPVGKNRSRMVSRLHAIIY